LRASVPGLRREEPRNQISIRKALTKTKKAPAKNYVDFDFSVFLLTVKLLSVDRWKREVTVSRVRITLRDFLLATNTTSQATMQWPP